MASAAGTSAIQDSAFCLDPGAQRWLRGTQIDQVEGQQGGRLFIHLIHKLRPGSVAGRMLERQIEVRVRTRVTSRSGTEEQHALQIERAARAAHDLLKCSFDV